MSARPFILRCAACLLVCILGAGAVAAAPATLGERRAAQRAKILAAARTADKAAGGAPFALLVIPVDFADARLPAGWQPAAELGPRLDGDGQTLQHYFAVASGGACDLRVTLAPLVSLPGNRRDYSDVDLNGFTRTRRLATEALTAARDLGVPFRSLDDDGPDRVPGTADDDGQVDGVLILHAGIGQENDVAAGFVQPLQYFLDAPVVQDGVAASSYAVAAMRSGLGIWAHETGHLLGLEERYDLRFAASGESELHSRGGLGRFSLMAAGAWGTGGGAHPALLDAYSRWQLGWCAAADLPATGTVTTALESGAAGGTVHRIWTDGRPGDEFYLLEVRAPVDGFDAAVPAGDLVIYHVDETVSETAWSTDGGIHLRVQLVEADGAWGLRDGLDEGSDADLFPGSTGATAFGPGTVPSSDGWRGPSQVSLTAIHRVADPAPGVAYTVSASDGPAVTVALSFLGQDPATLSLSVRSVGAPVTALSAQVAAGNPANGAFVGGGTSRTLALTESSPGLWVPADPPAWQPDPGLPPDAATRFVVTVTDGVWTSPAMSRTWTWADDTGALDFAGAWPGAWTVSYPDGDTGTTWQRWDDRSPAAPAGGYVLACVAVGDSTGATWPDVAYDNGAHAVLTSPPLGTAAAAVRIVHAWDTEDLEPGVFMDGAAAFWVGPDGAVTPARPVDGWPGRVGGQSLAALHGQGAWGGPGDLTAAGAPVWRTDVLPVPAEGPGPWRLRLVFAANTRGWDYRGWQVRDLQVLTAPVASALPVVWDGTELAWTWPRVPAGDPVFTVQLREDGAWRDLLARTFEPPFVDGRFAVPAGEILAALPGGPRARAELRVAGPWGAADQATLASGAVVVFPDGGGGLATTFGAPWPNPATGGVRFRVTVPAGAPARLGIYDVAGRLVVSFAYPPGDYVVRWDGTDAGGRRAAAGTYILRLEGSDGVRTHKVVLLH